MPRPHESTRIAESDLVITVAAVEVAAVAPQ